MASSAGWTHCLYCCLLSCTQPTPALDSLWPPDLAFGSGGQIPRNWVWGPETSQLGLGARDLAFGSGGQIPRIWVWGPDTSHLGLGARDLAFGSGGQIPRIWVWGPETSRFRSGGQRLHQHCLALPYASNTIIMIKRCTCIYMYMYMCRMIRALYGS